MTPREGQTLEDLIRQDVHSIVVYTGQLLRLAYMVHPVDMRTMLKDQHSQAVDCEWFELHCEAGYVRVVKDVNHPIGSTHRFTICPCGAYFLGFGYKSSRTKCDACRPKPIDLAKLQKSKTPVVRWVQPVTYETPWVKVSDLPCASSPYAGVDRTADREMLAGATLAAKHSPATQAILDGAQRAVQKLSGTRLPVGPGLRLAEMADACLNPPEPIRLGVGDFVRWWPDGDSNEEPRVGDCSVDGEILSTRTGPLSLSVYVDRLKVAAVVGGNWRSRGPRIGDVIDTSVSPGLIRRIPRPDPPAPIDPLDVEYDGVRLRTLLDGDAFNRQEQGGGRYWYAKAMTPAQRAAVSAHWSAELRAKVAVSTAAAVQSDRARISCDPREPIDLED